MLWLHPRLQDCRCLFLRHFEISTHIGVHAFEKNDRQRVHINVEVYIPLAISTPKRDALEEVIDYDFIRQTIRARTDKGHIHLQETLCDDIAAALLAHPAVHGVRVTTEKPDVYDDCASVGVEVFHLK